MNNSQDDLDQIEEEIKEKDLQKSSASRRTHQKVSGKSVFELQEIIKTKGENAEKGNSKK